MADASDILKLIVDHTIVALDVLLEDDLDGDLSLMSMALNIIT